MSDVNPFEPWRPRDAGRSGRDEEIYPWCAAPQQEATSDDREIPYHVRRGGKPLDDSPRVPPPSGANALLALMAFALVVAVAVVVGNHGVSHVWRAVTTAACLWVGSMVGLSLLHRRSWSMRLTGVLIGAVAAAGCWMFFPVKGGMTWWQAQGILKNLRQLPAGDIAAFRASQPVREAMVRDFKEHRQEVDQLVARWVGATGSQIEAEVADRGRGPVKKLARLEEIELALMGMPQRTQIQSLLARCWQKVVADRLGQIEKESLALAEKGQFHRAHDSARTAGDTLKKQVAGRAEVKQLDGQIRKTRGKVFALHLQQARARLEALQAKGDQEEISREGRRLYIDLLECAELLNTQAQVNAVLLPFREKALLARIERARSVLEGVLDREGPEKVASAAVHAVKVLDDEANLLGKRGEVRRILFPVRQKAFDARLAHAAQSLQASIKKKDYEAVQALSRTSMTALGDEAREVGAGKRMEETLRPFRRTALLARLDQARERFRALLVKDDYAGIEVLANKTAAMLGEEAGQVGERKPLDAFTGRCRAFVKLAVAAGKK